MLFMTPAAALFIGAAVSAILNKLAGWADGPGRPWIPIIAGRATGAAIVILTLAPVGLGLARVAAPQPRPDCRAAAAYILKYPGAKVPIMITAWDQSYFLRSLDPARLRYRPSDIVGRDDLVWVLISMSDQRHKSLGSLAAWRVIERRQFGTSTAVLLHVDSPGLSAQAGRPERGR
jgi:hypothetical protein